MLNIKKYLVAAGFILVTSLCLYAACTKNSAPSYYDKDYAVACQCPAVHKYFTDSMCQNQASLATCLTCTSGTAGVGGCNSTTEHYTIIYETHCPAGTVNGTACFPTPPTFNSGGSFMNAAKYEYLAAGCST